MCRYHTLWLTPTLIGTHESLSSSGTSLALPVEYGVGLYAAVPIVVAGSHQLFCGNTARIASFMFGRPQP